MAWTDAQFAFVTEVFYNKSVALKTWAIEYTDCISAEGQDNPQPNECL